MAHKKPSAPERTDGHPEKKTHPLFASLIVLALLMPLLLLVLAAILAVLGSWVFDLFLALVLAAELLASGRTGILARGFPTINGCDLIPTYGRMIAAANFDRSGTTRIGKYVLNHSCLLPGLVSTGVAVTTGLVIAKLFF